MSYSNKYLFEFIKIAQMKKNTFFLSYLLIEEIIRASFGRRTFSGSISAFLNLEESSGGYKTSTFEFFKDLKVSRKTFFVNFELTKISSAAPVDTSSNQSNGRL